MVKNIFRLFRLGINLSSIISLIIICIICPAKLNSQLKLDNDEDIYKIISQMTLAEKARQLCTDCDVSIPRLNLPNYRWHNEALHGIVTEEVTIFPTPVNLAATWNLNMIREIAYAISDEGRVKFNKGQLGLNYWTPNLDLVVHPRWGRNQETYGEDPFLVSQVGVEFIKGLQCDTGKYLKTIATPKHYAVHGGPELEKFNLNANCSERDLWETYMPSFKSAITEAGSYSIMTAYNAFRGVPMSVNNVFVDSLLRKAWGFDGFVVADCGTMSNVYWSHKYAPSESHATGLAIEAGVDMECGDYFLLWAEDAVEKNLLKESSLDNAVFRTFKARQKLGLFANPDSVIWNKLPDSLVKCAKHRELALDAARESIILLQNNDNLLPLNKNLKSVYLVGPNVDVWWELLGCYIGSSSVVIRPIDAIKSKLSKQANVKYDKGCELIGNLTEITKPKYLKTYEGQIGLKGEYYPNRNLSGDPVMVRVDTVINFDWAFSPPIKDSSIKEFSVRWTGKFRPEESGAHTFVVKSRDGIRLKLDGKKVIDAWYDHGFGTFVGHDTLIGGREYDIVIEYYWWDWYSYVSFEMGADYTCADQIDSIFNRAKNSDIIVFIGGMNTNYESELIDRQSVELPHGQARILKTLKKSGKPIVLVLLGGSSLAINWEKDSISAILLAGYGGESGGTAIADVLFGDFNPGGKLPYTFYKTDQDLPDMRDYYFGNRTYRFYEGEVLFPFGHGLSYTSFAYSNINIPSDSVTTCTSDSIKIAYNLKNTGKFAGHEISQLFIKNLSTKIKHPIKQLKGFNKRFLKPNELINDTISLSINDFAYYDTVLKDFYVESADYELLIGSSSEDIRLKENLNIWNCKDVSTPEEISELDNIYPIPASNEVRFNLESLPKGYYNLKVFNSIGQQQFIPEISRYIERDFIINCEMLNSGIYFIMLENSSGRFIRSFIVE